jgi:hypothetical protein
LPLLLKLLELPAGANLPALLLLLMLLNPPELA